jgi:hypothetical protein
MNLDSAITIFGTVASVIGAGIAFYEAKNAKYYANKVKDILEEFKNRRKVSIISQIHGETKRVISNVSKIGRSCSSSSIRGLSIPPIAKEVEEYSRLLYEHKDLFPDLFKFPSKNPCTELNNLVEDLINANTAKNFADIKKNGTKIYDVIYSFLPNIKTVLDKKQESYPNLL